MTISRETLRQLSDWELLDLWTDPDTQFPEVIKELERRRQSKRKHHEVP